ncbi:metallophosphoesterase family protein [Limibacter armeniacum]|uniref:metallophosphoesterase family protein n=1 Tax=Limibacter armeniacum TaxID=466084 RepID=UPI002FE54CFE
MINRIGIISDIHGNSLALEAVIEDMEKNHVNTILNLGDSLYGPLDPAGTFELISELKMISISGNQDRFILESREFKNKSNATLEFVLETLPEDAFVWLQQLEQVAEWNKFFLCHGNLQHDDVPLIETFQNGQVHKKDPKTLEEEIMQLKQPIILCGHTHVPHILQLQESKKWVINPGSVGLPAYDDDFPFYHKMESGSPYAKYTILDLEEDEVISISQRNIKYDFEHAALQAEKLNRSDWAYWIRTGLVK